MERMNKKLLVGIPHYSQVDSQFVTSLSTACIHMAENGYQVNTFYRRGALLSSQRNYIIQQAKEQQCDYLMFIDADIVSPENGIMKLIALDKPVAGGIYYARSDTQYRPLVFSEDLSDNMAHNAFAGIKSHDIPDHPFQVAGLATGYMLLRKDLISQVLSLSMVEQYGYPFNHWTMPNHEQLGEDLSFCHRCNLAGIEIWADPTIELGHVGSHIVSLSTHLNEIARDTHYCNDIPGWMTGPELDWLYKKAKQMKIIVEIGVWKGRSTHALLSGCRQGTVYAVDHFMGSLDERQAAHIEAKHPDKIKQAFLDNVGMFNNLRLLEMDSQDAFKIFANSEIDMVFIDGDHSYEGCKADLQMWGPITKQLIIGHDYSWPGVKQAVDEYFADKTIKTFGDFWYVEA